MGRLAQILRPHEWVGLAAGAALAVTIYAALIHPSLQLMGLETEAAGRRTAADRELAQLRNQYQQLIDAVALDRRRLKEIGGSPPLSSQKDRQIARVTALAKDCSVMVDQYSPIETVEQEDHEAVLLQFSGRAGYSAVRDYLRRLESEIDFVDITHFSIAKAPKEGVDECRLSWSVRVNGMRPATGAPARSDKRAEADDTNSQPQRGGRG
jgi:hypothetical protein